MQVYHVTFMARVPAMKQTGILPGLTPNWDRGNGSPYSVGAYVYAFEKWTDAVLWGSKMGWTFFQNSASSQVCVLTIEDKHWPWDEDTNDPLGRSAAAGRWLRRPEPVLPSAIIRVQQITTALIRQAIRWHKPRPDGIEILNAETTMAQASQPAPLKPGQSLLSGDSKQLRK